MNWTSFLEDPARTRARARAKISLAKPKRAKLQPAKMQPKALKMRRTKGQSPFARYAAVAL
jgi:hypothetical protein